MSEDDAADSATQAAPDEAFPWQQREEVDLDLRGAPTWDPTQYGPDDEGADSTDDAGRRRFRRARPRPSPTPRPARHGRAPGVPAPNDYGRGSGEPSGVDRSLAKRADAERLDAERLDAERLAAARADRERREAARIEAERIEAERIEAERIEAERIEAERIEAARIKAARVEAARVAAARAEAERKAVSITDDISVDLIDDGELAPGPSPTPRPHRPSPFVNPVPAGPAAAPASGPADVTHLLAPPAGEPHAPAAASAGERTARRTPPVLAYLGRRRGGIARFLVVVLVAAAVATVLRLFVVQTYYIPSESMEPTLHGCQGCTDDHVLVDKLSYHLHDVHVGDIVVFDRPPNAVGIADDVLIKRVVAVGGDRVTLRKTKSGAYDVLVNGAVSPESVPNPSWLSTHCNLSQINAPETGTTTWAVPTNDVFVMGDNRCNSDDSRTFGPITTSSIVGRAVLIVWPLHRIGSV